jgi:hypothetical protein
MIIEYLKADMINHRINRVIVAKHDVREEYLCEIEDSNGKRVRAFRLIDNGATGEVETMPYDMLRKLRAVRPVPMDESRRPNASEMASIRAKCILQLSEEDEKFIFLGAFDPSRAGFYNEMGTLITTINIFDDIKVIVTQAGGSMPDKKDSITFDHLMDSFERPIQNPFFKK